MGVDEAGRGCLAGPVVAAAVVLPEDFGPPDLDDSKALNPSTRHSLEPLIRGAAISLGLAEVGPDQIDRLGILKATLHAMRAAVLQALHGADRMPAIIVVDGRDTIDGIDLPQKAWPKGDKLSVNCAAASILAKEHRDRLMVEADALYPCYGFARHKGYATARHLEALRRLGPCPLHRHTFRPVAEPSTPIKRRRGR